MEKHLNFSFIPVYNRLHELLRFLLFTIFFLLSIRFLLSYLIAAPVWMVIAGCCGILLVFLLCWWRLLFCLFVFITAIPIVSGIQNIGIMDGIPLFSFGFSCIYIAWFLKRVFYQKQTIDVNNTTDVLIDLFALVIIISFFMSLSQYPFEFVMYRLKFASVLRQSDPFWSIEASFILLQGLFLYRIFSLEGKNQNWSELINKILFFQTLIIIAFSSVQFLLLLNNAGLDQIKIFWPFDDIHSYGSYIVFLFFYYISQMILNKKYNKFSLFASFMLFVFIIFSYSRATWLSFIILSIVILFLVISRTQKKILLSVLIIFFALSFLFGPLLLKSDNNYLYRLGRLTSITNYANDKSVVGRIVRWKIALQIIEDFPVTGSGIGSYLRLAPSYLSFDTNNQLRQKIRKKWNASDNVHNYYLQLWAEIGTIGLFIFLFVLICVYQKRNPQAYGLILGLSAYLITMITSHPLIISKQQFLFWFIVSAIVLESSAKKEMFAKSKIGTIVFSLPFILFVVLLPGYFLNARTIEEIEGINYNYGFYGNQKIEKEKVRWTMKMSGSKELAKTDIIGIRVYAMPEIIPKENLYLDIFINNTQIDRVSFKESGFKDLYYHIPGIKNHEYLFRTKINKTFNPYKLGLTGNLKHSRDQGIALRKIRYLTKWPRNYKKIGVFTY